MPRTLIVVDSPQAARALAEHELRDVVALTTHCAAADALAARGIECSDCSDLVEPAQAGAAIREASAELDARLDALDAAAGAAMSAAAGLPRLALFRTIFKYLGQYNLAGLRCFESILDSRLAAGDIRAVRFCHALPTSTDRVFSFVAAARRLASERGVAFEETAVAFSNRSPLTAERALTRIASLAARAPRRFAQRLRRRFHHASGAGHARRRVLLVAPGERSFFEDALADMRTQFLYVGDDGSISAGGAASAAAVDGMKGAATQWLRANASDPRLELERLVVAETVRNADAWLRPAVDAHRLVQSRRLTAAAWDTPLPTRPHLNLVVEVLLRSGVPVLGRQHGASYGDQDLGRIHFDSDFDRCTHFFSYGFGPAEIAATYPTARPTCSFIPAGNPALEPKPSAKPVDLVFPIAHRVPLFYLARLPEAAMARRQARILAAMEARSDLVCVVKPAPGESTHDERLRHLKHVQVVRAPWRDYLRRFSPRLVVCEVASTPLTEVLPLDVDVFLMLDPLFPFSAAALALLRKRAHIFETADELAAAIAAYGRAELPRLRDRSYYDTYVNRGSPSSVRAAVADLERARG